MFRDKKKVFLRYIDEYNYYIVSVGGKMALNSVDQSVEKLLINCSFLVPSNQRKYVWNRNNWRELLDDLQLVVAGQIEEHFIGSIVLKKEEIDDGIRNHYSIIDGQQRVLTMTLLISAIGYLYAENEQYALFNGLEKYILINIYISPCE